MSSPSLEREFEIYASVVREKLAELKRDAMASDFVQALTAGKAAIDGFKILASYANEVTDLSKRGELIGVIGELSLELADAQLKLGAAMRENDNLKEQLNTLTKEIKNLKNPDTKLIIRGGLYYTLEGDEPFCTGCYDNNEKRIHVVRQTGSLKSAGRYKCPVCSTTYSKNID